MEKEELIYKVHRLSVNEVLALLCSFLHQYEDEEVNELLEDVNKMNHERK